MTTPKQDAQRQREATARRKAAGLHPLKTWVPKETAAALDREAAAAQMSRADYLAQVIEQRNSPS